MTHLEPTPDETTQPTATAPRSASRWWLGGTRRTRMIRSTALVAAAGLVVGIGATASAVTKITVTNPTKLTAVGPVNSTNGFPAWYEDANGVRIEPCLDQFNPFCGFLPGDVPDPTAPIDFPGNFPGENFYSLVSSTLALPGGGRAVLTLGLEATFANGDPIAGDQVVFARTRVTVRGAAPNTTLTFKHPYGELTIDTDATGAGKITQDITPTIGNFATPLAGNFGPFLKWDPAVAPAAPAGYLGDPAQEHPVTGGLNGNVFSMTTPPGFPTTGVLSTNLFTLSGKIATNTGVQGTYAKVNGNFVDVFATSRGTQIQITGDPARYDTTPMTNDPGTELHYARLQLKPGATVPTQIQIKNLGDSPVAVSTVNVADISISEAVYNGTQLTVLATGSGSLKVTGIPGPGTLISGDETQFNVTAPPPIVTVTNGTASATLPVTVTGGNATPPGELPVPPQTPGPPVVDQTPDNPASPLAVTIKAPAATLPGGSVTLDATGSNGDLAWTQVSGPAVTIVNGTSITPTVTLPFFAKIADTAPVTTWQPITLKLTASRAGASTVTQTITIPVKTDIITPGNFRQTAGKELRIAGDALVDGAGTTATPQSSVNVYAVIGGVMTKLGTSPVDTLGAFDLRLKPGPTATVTQVIIQSTRGANGTFNVVTK